MMKMVPTASFQAAWMPAGTFCGVKNPPRLT